MKIDLGNYLNGKATTIMRFFIVAMIFISVITLQGMQDMRQAHQIVFMLAVISLFSLILRNIWITLFVLWTVFLYSFFKFDSGNIYLSYIFFGAAYYLITKVAFKKENVNLFINGYLWFVFANVAYMAVQASGFDFIYSKYVYLSQIPSERGLVHSELLRGFMGNPFSISTVLALGIPILASRNSRWAWVGALGLFFPLILTKTSLCFIMGAVGFLFVLYFKVPRRVMIITIITAVMSCSVYLMKVDKIGTERFIQWHKVLSDSMIHPVTGWGLDSFANVTKYKNFRYAQKIDEYTGQKDSKGVIYEKVRKIAWWDNPHNLLISIQYEFGAVGLFLFIGYIRQNVLRFKSSLKSLNVIGLAGFILVFLGISMGHFPIYLARMAAFIIPAFSLFEICTE